MWFAALGGYEQNPWLGRFLERLLEGSPEVAALLANDPFPGRPPRYVRAVLYDYRFTNAAERGRTGAWWKRRVLGLYAPGLRSAEASGGRKNQNSVRLEVAPWSRRRC